MSTFHSLCMARVRSVARVVLPLIMLALVAVPAPAQPGGPASPPDARLTTIKTRLDSLLGLLRTGRATQADSANVTRLRATLDSLTASTPLPASDSLPDSDAVPARDSIPPPLRFTNLKARSDVTKGVIAGGMVTLELSRMPESDTPTVRMVNLDPSAATDTLLLQPFEIDGKNLVVLIPDSVSRGMYLVEVFNGSGWRVLVERPHHLRVEKLWRILLWALAPIVAIILLLAWALSIYRKGNDLYRDPGRKKRNLLGMLLLEPQNYTYSLSRAQFVYWTAIIAFSYVFLFVARGLVESIWTFPSLEGFAWTFIISLGTLLVAQGTSSVRGAKGAGEFHPSPADLFVHGGVLALERVQQVLWTLIASGLFLFILIKNYAVSTTIPTIPEQLLYLMGISSAGYLTGKAIRKPGPIIDQISFVPNPHLSIKGKHLSNTATVWVDGVQLQGDTTSVLPDPDDEKEFSNEIQIPLPESMNTPEKWFGAPRIVRVVNADGQRADWSSKPEIVNATLQGSTLTVVARYVDPNAQWSVNGTAKTLVRDQSKPNTWTLTYQGDVPKTIDKIVLTSPNGTVTYTPTGVTSENAGAPGSEGAPGS